MKQQPQPSAQHRSSMGTHAGPGARHTRVHRLKRQIRASQPLHVRTLLHPIGIFMMLLIGVLIVGVTLRAAADSYSLNAKVPAALLSEGAIITSPASGSTFATNPITVSGSCPDNSYVKLSRNGAFDGAAWCVSNSFSIQSSLNVGSNVLQAQDYNITDDLGPATLPITLTYTPPVPPATITPTKPARTQPATTVTPSLTLSSDYHFQSFPVGSPFTWQLDISGSEAPYNVAVSWGDGTTSTESSLPAGPHKLSHHYAKAGYFPILITATDALGTGTTLQLAALIKTPGAISFMTTKPEVPSSGLNGLLESLFATLVDNKGVLWIAWPAYAVVVLMAVSFWLGERQILMNKLAVQRTIQPGRQRSSRQQT